MNQPGKTPENRQRIVLGLAGKPAGPRRAVKGLMTAGGGGLTAALDSPPFSARPEFCQAQKSFVGWYWMIPADASPHLTPLAVT